MIFLKEFDILFLAVFRYRFVSGCFFYLVKGIILIYGILLLIFKGLIRVKSYNDNSIF